MFTSDTDSVKRWLRRGLIFTSAAAFCALFGAVYEVFSHGVYSYSMIYAFAYPLLFGAIPSLIMALLGKPCRTCAAFDLYVFAVATAAVGSIVNGVLEIYGTSSRLAVSFPILASAFALGSLICTVNGALKARRNRDEK